MDRLPEDPIMLFSAVNMKLRDIYSSLDELCADMNIDRTQLEAKLKQAGFDYIPAVNQFR
ncbi:MAG: DUF4250 domain-containing protein [Muribaculaceae bacterium]|nr:DUF4250 domain-containing protein [Muribaculaceae bacterium]